MCLPMEICCCCISLETGTKIVAVVHVVVFALVTVLYGSVAATLTYLPPTRRHFYELASAIAAAMMLLSILLTYGTFKRKPRLMWPWTVMAWISSVLLIGFAILGTVLLSFPSYSGSFSEINPMISVYFISAVTLYYSASVVNSRRLEMMHEDRSEATEQLVNEVDVPKSLFIFEDVA